ncbi:MAG: endonuclease/exonuclease/phosphatase family protein [Dongiaceae bacterium]
MRLRIATLERLVAAFNPDVLCLQETKVVDENFPLAALATLGYRHAMVHGMKSYNGVAILSRLPLANATNEDVVRPQRLPARHREAARRHRTAQRLCAGGRRHSRSGGKSKIRAQAAISR